MIASTTTRDLEVGDEQKLFDLLRRQAMDLRGYLARRIPPKHKSVISPEDLLQEVWVAAFRTYPAPLLDEPDDFAKWLTTLTKSKLLDALRFANAVKRGRHVPRQEDDNTESSLLDIFDNVASPRLSPSREISAKEAVDAVRVALASLPDGRCEAMWMYHIEGKRRQEIAERLGKSIPAVARLLAEGREQLRQRLGRESKFFSSTRCSTREAGT